MQKSSLKLIKIFLMFIVFIAILLVIAKSQLAYVENQIKTDPEQQQIQKLLHQSKQQQNQEEQSAQQSQPQEEQSEQQLQNQQEQSEQPITKLPENISYDDVYQSAIKLANEKDYDAAIKAFELCVDHLDESKQKIAHKYIANIAYNAKMYDKAQIYITRVLNNQILQNAEKKKYETMLADCYYELNMYQNALDVYKRNYDDNQNLGNFKKMANVLMKLDEKEELNTYYQKHIKAYSFDKQDLIKYKKYLDENMKN